jgi:hypothetical protein
VTLSENTLYALIFACEVGFWLVLGSGLAFRYILRWNRLSWLCLLSLPLIDLALLAFTILDLRSGAIATTAHGLATAYIGFTVAFGAKAIAWADQKFAQKFASTPPTVSPTRYGWAEVRHELELWARCLLAVAIIYLLLFAMIKMLNRPDQTQALEEWYPLAKGTAFFWFLFGPLWSLIFFKRATSTPEQANSVDAE